MSFLVNHQHLPSICIHYLLFCHSVLFTANQLQHDKNVTKTISTMVTDVLQFAKL